jgi:IclR family transcriptional regulator, acetate operon repressor
MSADPPRNGPDGTALRALRVLEVLSRPGGPHRLGDIARDAGLAKPSTHRILGGLASAGYVVSDGTGTYSPGPRAYALSALFVAGQRSDPDTMLRQLQSEVDQTVHVALRSGNVAIYVQKVESDRPYQMASRVGGQIQLHCTAIGKAILAHIPRDDRQAVVAGGLPAHTANTITDAVALEAELDRVRAAGYAIDDEENEDTIRCIAAPLLDRSGHAVGGLSISTITFQVSTRELRGFAPRLVDTARLLAPIYT